MSIILIALFVGALLPIALSWVGGYYRMQQFGSVDNKHPRVQSAGLEGAGARAVAAQSNAWEALANRYDEASSEATSPNASRRAAASRPASSSRSSRACGPLIFV